jgi:hypothetical protein
MILTILNSIANNGNNNQKYLDPLGDQLDEAGLSGRWIKPGSWKSKPIFPIFHYSNIPIGAKLQL